MKHSPSPQELELGHCKVRGIPSQSLRPELQRYPEERTVLAFSQLPLPFPHHPQSPPASPRIDYLTFTVPLVLGELKARAAFTGDAPFGGFSADVGTAVVFVHAIHSF